MAFTPKTWLQRVVENPGRRLLTATGTTNVWDITRNEGVVVQDGDAFSVANMNDLETRIDSAFANIQDELGWIDITSQCTWHPLLLTSYTYYAKANPKIRMIEVTCVLSSGVADGAALFTLPAAYRPVLTRNMAMGSGFDKSANISVVYYMNTTGALIGSHTAGATTGDAEFIHFNFIY